MPAMTASKDAATKPKLPAKQLTILGKDSAFFPYVSTGGC
jgi:hypothetical protein